ncbi:type II toxin-antitoxin system mRNA interferase toxin, RelE/StbE family [Desulfobacterales bacterium HSG2]|nr:type II toxin-antitoxin system mRNA interferase toxin, RelE/StbE family [Desulfobacterales bacterium HSG2]
MVKITFSSSFKRAFKKKIKNRKDLEAKFWKAVKIFAEDPFDSNLKTHKLSGKLRDLWSFSIDYDLRVIFYFPEKNKSIFVSIGKHDEVY